MPPVASGSRSPSPATKRVKLSQSEAFEHSLNYRDGLFLAPMVRCGTLPTRLLSLDYGASLVWGPEIIDRAMIGSERVVDKRSGTVQYMKNGKAIFESHPIEKSRLIYQIGSSDPELALQAARLVKDDVAGVDLNCGCPKDFSLKGGMGAALLKTPDKLCSILRNLTSNLSLPVSCKIRLLPTQEATLALVRQIGTTTGISNLTVHCRTQEMRDREPAMLERLKDIVDVMKEYGIPVVANGDCWGEVDRERICKLTGVTSIMIARGAERNPSCFSPSGFVDPMEVIIPHYIRIAMFTSNHFGNSKYVINAMDLTATNKPSQSGVQAVRKQFKQDVSRIKDYKSMCELIGLDYENCAKEELEDILPGLKDRLAKEDAKVAHKVREEVEEQADDSRPEEDRRRKLPQNGSGIHVSQEQVSSEEKSSTDLDSEVAKRDRELLKDVVLVGSA